MNLPLAQQTVLITGAGRGLGAAIARAFAREGAQVAINYRKSRNAAEALAAELGPRAAAVQADVTDAGQVTQMVAAITERFGAPDVLVHNALAKYSFNGDARTPLERLSWAEMTAQLETEPPRLSERLLCSKPTRLFEGVHLCVERLLHVLRRPMTDGAV